MMNRFMGQHGVAALAQLSAAGRFSEPADVLTAIQGLSADDIQYVVDNTDPFAMIAPDGLLGDSLFPERRTQDLQFGYLKGAAGSAVMAHVSAHNSEAPLIGRRGAETVQGQIPSIRIKLLQDALTLIKLQSADELVRSSVVQDIYDDVTAVRLGVAARVEKIRMDALANGVASVVNDENLVFSVDYGVPTNQKVTLTGTDQWDDAGSDPLADLEAWQNLLINAGQRPAAVAVTSSAVINALRRHDSIRQALWGKDFGDRRVGVAEMNDFFASQGLPRFVAYDLTVQEKQANGSLSTVRMWPQHKVTLLPGGPVGRTLRAPTAEEGLQGSAVADGAIVVDGNRTAVHVYTATQDPKGIVTLGVGSQFASFEGADGVVQAAVLAAS